MINERWPDVLVLQNQANLGFARAVNRGIRTSSGELVLLLNPDTMPNGEAIDTLADREREVLVLKEFENMKYREIAALLGIPIGTVMSRLYSARRHLAAAIEERP